MDPAERGPDDEAAFLEEVIRGKRANGSLTPAWVSAAALAWPVALAVVLAALPAGAVAGALGAAAGAAGAALGSRARRRLALSAGEAAVAAARTVGLMIGAGLGVYAARTLRDAAPSAEERAREEVAQQRLRRARRTFTEIQALRDVDPVTYRDELERLLSQVVDDRDDVEP